MYNIAYIPVKWCMWMNRVSLCNCLSFLSEWQCRFDEANRMKCETHFICSLFCFISYSSAGYFLPSCKYLVCIKRDNSKKIWNTHWFGYYIHELLWISVSAEIRRHCLLSVWMNGKTKKKQFARNEFALGILHTSHFLRFVVNT